jgi:hypothetical protein
MFGRKKRATKELSDKMLKVAMNNIRNAANAAIDIAKETYDLKVVPVEILNITVGIIKYKADLDTLGPESREFVIGYNALLDDVLSDVKNHCEKFGVKGIPFDQLNLIVDTIEQAFFDAEQEELKKT